jgi:hypothetical protein
MKDSDKFEKYAVRQYQQDLLFSSLVDLMSTVVCGIHPSVNAAYRAKAENLTVFTTALYNKLQGIEIEVSQGLLAETAQQLEDLCSQMGDSPESMLPGYDIRIADGSCLASSEHRLKPTRVKAKQVWMGDRNFCTAHFLTSIDHQQGFFVIREHKSLPTQEVSLLKSLGEINSGKLFSQMISINFEGKTVHGRRGDI